MRSEQLKIKIKDTGRVLLAKLTRLLPGAWRLLGLPRKRIRHLSDWVDSASESLDWIQRGKGPHYEVIAPPLRVIRHAPRHALNEGPVDVLSRERFHRHNELFVARIPDAQIVGPTGTVLTPDGGIVEESTWGTDWLGADPSMRAFRLSPEYTPGTYLSLAAPFSDAYAHWLLESLPRLIAFDRIPSDDVQLILPRATHSYHYESLAMVGIDEAQCVTLGESHLEVDVLYFPSWIGGPGNLHPVAAQWYRDRFGTHLDPQPSRRFFITRRAADRRRLVNEEELEPILAEHGFEIVDPGELSFRQQVELFGQAEAVVTLHGSALANILFAPPGCKVMELRDPVHLDTCFYAVADVMQQEYWYLIAERVTSPDAVDPSWVAPPGTTQAWHDLHVPAPDFAKGLTALLDD